MRESKTKNGIQKFDLDSWREFFDLTSGLFANGSAYIYRGQTNYDWPLISSLDRLESRYPERKNLGGKIPEFFTCPPFSEEEHLNAFKRAIRGRRGHNPTPLTEDECWALGQHHGLATPLLDWTRSPFAALFFAFEEEKCFVDGGNWSEPEYRGVYMLSTSTIETVAKDDSPSVRMTNSGVTRRIKVRSVGWPRPRRVHSRK